MGAAGERSVWRKRPFFAKATKGRLGLLPGLGAGFPGVALVPRLPLATFFDPSGIGEEERGFMRRGGRLRSAAQRTERTTLLAHARVIHGTLKCWAASQWSDEWALLVSTA